MVCPIPIDDAAALATGAWDPWTFPPVCARPKNGNGSKLCAFTLKSLRGGAGLSLITTPEVAAGYVHVLMDPDIAWIERARGFPFGSVDPPPYEANKMPGKGVGVIANRTIHKDEVVIFQVPIMLQLMDTANWDSADVLKLLHRAANRLPQAEQEKMLDMARSSGGYIIDDIMKTNSFALAVNGVFHSALYPEIAVRKPKLW